MTWKLAPALDRFRAQINAAYPGRDKSSDGTIGDSAHAARRSDHNEDPAGFVKAFDLTHDPKHGADCNKILAALIASNDQRVNYFIWNRGIYYRTSGFKRQQYNGQNAHDKHMHTSVRGEPKYRDDKSDWAIGSGPASVTSRVIAAVVEALAPAKPAVLKVGSKGTAVKELQVLLGVAVDGDFGAFTEKAVRAAQKELGLVVDGIAGPYTIAKLKEKKPAPVDDFDKVMAFVFEDEGGVTVSNDEPGGISVYGVSRTAWNEYNGLPATVSEMKSLTKEQAKKFYRESFWNKVATDKPAGYRYAAFDWSLNSGIALASYYIKQNPTIDALCDARLAYLRTLSNWSKYGKGWTNRVERVRKRAKTL